MPFFIKNNETIFFSHCPKTGGSSVEKYMETNNGYAMEFFNYNKKNICSFQHRHNTDPQLLSEIKKRTPIYSFTIIRHPIDRAVSEFFHKHDKNLHHTTTSEDFHNWVISTVEEYQTNNFIRDNHIRPQVEFLHEGIDIYKFGEWNKLMEGIAKHCTLISKTFPHQLKGTARLTALTYCRNVLKWSPNTKTVEILEDFYKEDLKLFLSLC